MGPDLTGAPYRIDSSCANNTRVVEVDLSLGWSGHDSISSLWYYNNGGSLVSVEMAILVESSPGTLAKVASARFVEPVAPSKNGWYSVLLEEEYIPAGNISKIWIAHYYPSEQTRGGPTFCSFLILLY